MRYLFLLLYVCLFSSVLNSQTPDTIPPYLTCKTPGEVSVKHCIEVLNAADILDSLYDDSSPITLGIHRKCQGYDFPTLSYVFFSEWDLGPQTVSLWARDAVGNVSSCTTSVQVKMQVQGFCDPDMRFSYRTPLGKGIDSLLINIKTHNCDADTFNRSLYIGTLGCCQTLSGEYSQLGTVVPAPGYEGVVEIIKNDAPLNGVTTYDLTLVSKHILGLELLDSPYKIIAADANQDGKVTTFDVVVLRKLILGIVDELPNGKSWRFLPKGYVFPNAANPFAPPFPEQYLIHAADPGFPTQFHFIGVKIGDVNFSAFPGG